MQADGPAEDDLIARLHALGADLDAGKDNADAGGVDEHAVAFAPLHDFAVAGHHLDVRLAGRLLDRQHDAPEVLHQEPLLQDEAAAQEERPGAAHRQVVARAEHGQPADVAAGEERRLHDVGVGAEGKPLIAEREQRAVVQRRQERVVEGRQQHALDQVLRQPPAAAVGEEHARVLADRYRTLGEHGRHRLSPRRAYW